MTEAEIADGIKKDEFVFFYQPKISLLTGKVFGAEALIRWLKPDGSIITPDAFIPIAEQSSLIKDITRHMFPKLVEDLLLMMDIEPMTISFNTSAKDFEDDVFTKMILSTLETSRLPGSCLQVELTETVALEAGDRIKKNILPLREAGVGLAMDDFGKGYSSLDTLSQWPFTTIKLDQGIISRMFDSDKSLTIVETSIRMAHELGISVVAEGVENSAQYHRLLEAGCTKVQGFWISKPLPLDKYIAFVKEDIRWSGLPIGLIHMAIIDHMQWRKKLVSELVKAVSFPKNSPHREYLSPPPLSYQDCKLGHWYNGVGQMFQDRQSFKNLAKPHFEIHNIGKSIVKLVSNGANMEDLTSHLRELSALSMEVLGLLQELEIEGMVDMHAAHDDWLSHSLHPVNQS
jgi:EAL domain-containing protein (putative c-di-GMP-specific phosphodiesterase class I)